MLPDQLQHARQGLASVRRRPSRKRGQRALPVQLPEVNVHRRLEALRVGGTLPLAAGLGEVERVLRDAAAVAARKGREQGHHRVAVARAQRRRHADVEEHQRRAQPRARGVDIKQTQGRAPDGAEGLGDRQSPRAPFAHRAREQRRRVQPHQDVARVEVGVHEVVAQQHAEHSCRAYRRERRAVFARRARRDVVSDRPAFLESLDEHRRGHQREHGLREPHVGPVSEVEHKLPQVVCLSREVDLLSQRGLKLPQGLVEARLAEGGDEGGGEGCGGHHDAEVSGDGVADAWVADLESYEE